MKPTTLSAAQCEALQWLREIEDNVRERDRRFGFGPRPRKPTLHSLFKLGLLRAQQVSRTEYIDGDGLSPYAHTYMAYRLTDAGRAALATL